MEPMLLCTPIKYLDDGLWMEILMRVGVKTICRFRCVCKSWNSLISSSIFITAQFNTAQRLSSNSINSYIIFSPFTGSPKSYAFYKPQEFPLVERLGFRPVPFPPKRPNETLRVIGVIHGVVCLSREGSTILWNPIFPKFIEIPRPASIRDVGFGFDGSKNDFKVVRISGNPPTFEALNVREGRVKRVDTNHIGPCSFQTYTGCFKNGAIHWIIKGRRSVMELLVFDCEREEFRTMELPQEFNDEGRIVKPFSLIMYYGMVSVWTSMPTMDENEFALWVMEEYGVVRSWKKVTPFHGEFVLFEEDRVSQFALWVMEEYGLLPICLKFSKTDKGLKIPHQPWNGHVFEPTVLLMDAN